ncbi:inositol monophosphatase family protein [Actinomadura kijaniata]|uniref:Myo-inositol-1(Or 4)-monophosphatase n=1 Tax=Actinomadura namibiensis TaxID=182080 RepID=A0A7W3LTI3_ACTNM|nr:inositol monophosphatase family protein [Actinomadura namibiensis]MBA8953925.1 myo-inositol-1(or 4)-monophosphatase [Actinomadura namibiensis]
MTDLKDLLPIAQAAVDLASRFIKEHPVERVVSKGDRDMASDVDVKVERAVRDFLQTETPHMAFLGEEDGGDGSSELSWVLDPIDGTANFVRGIPLCAVSLAVLHHGRPALGVIELPFLQGIQYHAVEGHGAFRDGAAISASTTKSLPDAIVAVGDYAVGVDAAAKNRRRLALTTLLADRVQRVRMFGTAAIDLAWAAEGRIDACVSLSNKPWDVAAGVIISREAGADVVGLAGEEHHADSEATIAVTPTLRSSLFELIESAIKDADSGEWVAEE